MCGGNRVDLPRMQQGWCHDHSVLCCLPYLKGRDVELLMLLDLHLKRREIIFEARVGGQQMVSTKNMRRKLVFVCKQG